MSFALIEEFSGFAVEVDIIARILRESTNDRLLIETADDVLSHFYSMLQQGGRFTPQEAEDFAHVMAGLSHLTVDDNRQAQNINLTTPEGQKKLLNVIDHTGESKPITMQLRRIATDHSDDFKKLHNRIIGYREMSPFDQHSFKVDVNKLRLGYKKLRQQITNGEFEPN